ncbi:tonoplast intrinsic protein 2;2 [Tasmannia lanceolata]|uniref:tonoplast intrinsic protein 2;2 n=1 Tax=Tasmannia lanceolata TaxID=3420 RepID=UPI004064038B
MGWKTLHLMERVCSPPTLRSYFAEFISTFMFVFAGVGSAMAAGKLTSDAGPDETGLVAVALAHAFALFVAVYVSANISGGNVNPAVTLGLVVGGHVSILNGLCYCGAQLLGSTMACLLLMLVTAGQAVPTHALASEMTGFGGAVMESVTTFALVYTVYATRDPKKGSQGIMGPLAIGFVVGAGILASGPFTGGSMNPARSFGPAVITGDFKNHGVYWVGPLMGGGIAGLLYENVMSLTSCQPSSVPNDGV